MEDKTAKVPLPSATESEHQFAFERQKTPPQVEKIETESVHSESDNEGVDDDVVDSVIENLNLDEAAFDKIVPTAKVESGLLETDIDAIVEKAVEIVSGKIDDVKAAAAVAAHVESKKEEKSEEEAKIAEKIVKEEEIRAKSTDKEENSEEKAKTIKKAEKIVKEEAKTQKDEEIVEKPAEKEEKIAKTAEEEGNIDKTEEQPEVNALTKEIIAQYSGSAEKPPVPIQTYLWEDIKRAKEQGGYPWTHLYKNPLGENEQPEVILTYKRSPKSGRRSESETGTPKAQKKVRTEVENAENIEPESSSEIVEAAAAFEDDDEDPLTELTDDIVKLDLPEVKKEKKTRKGILKNTQKILGQMKPSTPKFDSGSLKKKIKTPIAKIKKMADDGISKIKRIPSFNKSDNSPQLQQEKLEILRLKESPKSQHRDFASFIVKQDSDDTSVDIVDLEQSPSESRKNRGILTPDEIINLPVSNLDKSQETDSCRNDNKITIGDKRKEHHYEDIEDYISKIAFDSEHVERTPFQSDSKFKRQNNINDPIFDEFSRDLNRKIRKSLSAQDDSIKQELMKKIPKIEELEKQISDEDKEEKVEDSSAVKNPHLLAPISSIDSTSSDEDRKAQLSMVAEESETSDSNKKKSFDEPSVDIMDVESLQIDESDVSTLIDDEKILSGSDENVIEAAVANIEEIEDENVKKNDEKEQNEEKSENDKKTEESQQSPSNEEVKEDVIIAQNLESQSQIKINPKWSKMRKRIKDRKILRGQCKLLNYLKQCFRSL